MTHPPRFRPRCRIMGGVVGDPAARDAITGRRENCRRGQPSAHHTTRAVPWPLPLALTETDTSAPAGIAYVLVVEPVPLLPLAVHVEPTAAPFTRSVHVVVPDPP